MNAVHVAPAPVIALVGSAGGLEAISRVLEGLPGTLPAAVLVLLHQAPERTTDLTRILGRRSAFPVADARDGADLEPGTVRIVPPGRHLLLAPGPTLRLIVSGFAPPSRPSADLLLTTMATVLGPGAVAVVLSGGGHDGATGATAVHAFGGTVIASDESSSRIFSMPQATIGRDDAIDHVVPLPAIAETIEAVVLGLLPAPEIRPTAG